MKKIVLVLNQTQAGQGGEENSSLPLAGKKGALGPGIMMEPYLKEFDAKIIATLFCGDQNYLDNKEENSKKIAAMAKKLEADVIICGPAFNYERFGEMCGHLIKFLKEHSSIPCVGAMSEDNTAYNKYKDYDLVITPKKGGIGLNDALRNIVKRAVEICD